MSRKRRELGLREAEIDQEAVDADLEPPLSVEEEEQAERDEHDSARDLDQRVAVAEPAERSHRAGEREARDEERRSEAEGVRGEQDGPLQHRAARAREDQHRAENAADARRGANSERPAEQ